MTELEMLKLFWENKVVEYQIKRHLLSQINSAFMYILYIRVLLLESR